MQLGILLAAFGSDSQQGRNSLQHFEECVRQRFPDLPLRWAFTSLHMRERLARVHQKADSPGMALQHMASEGIDRVALQPLHVVQGLEYAEMRAQVARITQAMSSKMHIFFGQPLLGESCNLEKAVSALLASIPAERKPDEAVLWMGHGSQHASAQYYQRLGEMAAMYDPLVFVATLKGNWRLDDVLPELHVRRIWLLPLLALAGRHTFEDMAGADASSWLSQISARNIECIPVLRGMLDSVSFSAIWLDNLAQAVQHASRQ